MELSLLKGYDRQQPEVFASAAKHDFVDGLQWHHISGHCGGLVGECLPSGAQILH